MGEFDLSLIEEFRRRTSLYDRNSLQFKDKLYNAQQWQEISNKLGYDVSILKDRMLQLRNRYNLEKRRMEQLREEVPGKYHESPWPLYDSLQFLSNHIKARRRYKSILPVKEDSQMNDSGNDYSGMGPDDNAAMVDDDDGNGGDNNESQTGGMPPYPNGLLTVKVEDDGSEEQGSEEEVVETNDYRQQMLQRQRQQQLQQQQQQHLHLQQQQQLLIQRQLAQQQQHQQQQASRITKRNNNSSSNYEQNENHHHRPLHHKLPQLTTSTPLARGDNATKRPYDNTNDDINTPTKIARLNPRENKYNAFGNFIASSLLDLPQKMALELVEKFTSDIVKALTMKMDIMEANNSAANNTNDDDGDNHHHHHSHRNNHSQNSEQ